MKKFVQFLLTAHPAGGWFRKEVPGTKRKKGLKGIDSSLPPDSVHTRAGVKKKENPRHNPAP